MIRLANIFLILGVIQTGWLLAEPLSSDTIQNEYTKALEEPGALLFTPPEGWSVADPSQLPPRVKVMVIGKGAANYPPSMNLGMEPYKGTVNDYLKSVKAINDSHGSEWKNLGMITTQAGNASLSQVDMTTQWGDVRLMHVILKKDGILYVLTAAALKSEFSTFYKDFFAAFRSVRFNKDAFSMLASSRRKSELQKAVKTLQDNWQAYIQQNNASGNLAAVFQSDPFYHEQWLPFVQMLEKDYSDMGPVWKDYLLNKTKNDLLSSEKKIASTTSLQ